MLCTEKKLNIKINIKGYPELCHNWLDCFCFVLNSVGVEQNLLLFCQKKKMGELGCGNLDFFFGGGGLTIFWHESSSWVEIRLHTEFGRVWLCRS